MSNQLPRERASDEMLETAYKLGELIQDQIQMADPNGEWHFEFGNAAVNVANAMFNFKDI